MAVIRLTKEFSFEAAHALDGYDGPCREIHGHSYRLFVTVKGTPTENAADPKCGMVLDFGVLKRIVGEEIVSRFDHALVLRASESGAELFRVLTASARDRDFVRRVVRRGQYVRNRRGFRMRQVCENGRSGEKVTLIDATYLI